MGEAKLSVPVKQARDEKHKLHSFVPLPVRAVSTSANHVFWKFGIIDNNMSPQTGREVFIPKSNLGEQRPLPCWWTPAVVSTGHHSSLMFFLHIFSISHLPFVVDFHLSLDAFRHIPQCTEWNKHDCCKFLYYT